MLKISTKGLYGFEILLELAKQHKKEITSLSEIARRRKMSSSYLHQIIQPLKKAGIIQSKEGINGGYFLAKDPEKISIFHILESLEGPFLLVQCLAKQKKICQHSETCTSRNSLLLIQEDIKKTLEKRTLASLLQSPTLYTYDLRS